MFQQMMGGELVRRREGRATIGRSGLARWLLPLLQASVATAALLAVPAIKAQTTGQLNDTGIGYCGNDTGTVGCGSAAVDGSTHPRQDAFIGRDLQAAAGTLTPAKTGAGSKGFDFTKIANNGTAPGAGAALGSNPTDWACTRDNVTGLTWEVKTLDGLRGQNNTYSWYQNGVGTASKGVCSITGRCDTEKFVADVNAAALCGASDWRMPTVKELEGLVDYGLPWVGGVKVSAIDATYFPNTPYPTYYWSSAVDVSTLTPQVAWFVSFVSGSNARQAFSAPDSVRLVRGTQAPQQLVLTDNGTTVTDNSTGLMWKRAYETNSASAIPDTFIWSQALQRGFSDSTGGHTDWRLPSIKELRSLYDMTRAMPAIDINFFPATFPAAWFWTGSPYLDNVTTNHNWSWTVGGDNGGSAGVIKTRGTQYLYARLVRNALYAAWTPPSTPGAPVIGLATPGDASARIAFTAPADNGSLAPIDGYQASCSSGSGPVLTSEVATFNPATVTGLTNALPYLCSVQAHNANGLGPASGTVPVTPVAAPVCTFSISPSAITFGPGGGVGNVNVGATSSCAGWTAVSSNTSWLTVTAGASGSGNGSVSYLVTANTGLAQTGTVTIGTKTFSVTQGGSDSAPFCSLAASPTTVTAGNPSTLTATCSPAATSYAWTGLGCAGNTTNTCPVTPAVTTTYTVTASNGAGPGSPASATVVVPSTGSWLRNISTRAFVGTGNNVLIAGFIIGGSSPQTVMIRASGPSLAAAGLKGVLANPMMQLFSGSTMIDSNDDWGSSANATAITASGMAPSNALESAILTTLDPGAYTVIVSGVGGGGGLGMVEVFAQ